MTATADTKKEAISGKKPAEMPAFARMMRATVFACGDEALIEGAADNADNTSAAEKLAAA